MCDNPDADKYCMKLTEMPKSVQYSISKEDAIDFSVKEPTILTNLLQVTVKDRIIVFNIGKTMNDGEKPQEIAVFNASRQFIRPESFVESGFEMIQAYEDPTKAKDGYLVDRIIQNRGKELCFAMQDRENFDRKLDLKKSNLPETAICLGIFKKYAEIDIQELSRIQNKISKHGRLDNIDLQSVLSTYRGHTIFSIFAKETKFHEQMMIQMQEGEFEEEM